jgi:acyl-CoA synthetase (AMP-forming)/AMP-acid ligase II
MLALRDESTVGEVWADAVRAYGDRPFIAFPGGSHAGTEPDMLELSYAQVGAVVERWVEAYRHAGYGPGHRVAMLLENRVEHFVHKLALNTIGVSCVPINPDYRSNEIAYLAEHAEPALVLAVASRAEQAAQGIAESPHKPRMLIVDQDSQPPPPRRPAPAAKPTPSTEASLLYTSGTTGRPKGCMLSHGYEIAAGAWYAELPGLAGLRRGEDRIYNPLPLYHVNAGVVSLFGAICSGCCQIQSDRFHAQRWWADVVQTRATVVHYLGIVVQALMRQPDAGLSRGHRVRVGFGAGVEPQLHAAFEARFGFPLVEIWGMTEMVRLLVDSIEPRKVGTRAFGRATPGVDVRVVDDGDCDLPDGTPGEMLIRHSAQTPRRGAFSGYLKNEAETERAWRGGWFHTGDAVYREVDGMLHFVDRKKNIIRRAGENIAAAEVEALLLTHPDVAQAAVLALPDDMREEEVLACIVLKAGVGGRDAAVGLFNFCHHRLAYYKAPGWFWFTDTLPTTGTQKIQKHTIFAPQVDPRTLPGMIDLRELKKRSVATDTVGSHRGG